MLEASSFHPGRTAANHLKVYAQAAGLPLARVEETLGLVGLADVGGRKVGGFSLGMRQRLGLAYALLGDPGVLVLDEPANGLDPEGIKWMRGFLRRLAREGRTVFVSSHMLAEVQQTVDSVLIISRGRLVFQGAARGSGRPVRVRDGGRLARSCGAERGARGRGRFVRAAPLRPHRARPGSAGVGAIAASAGVALSSLQRRGPALEEVFLDLVSGARVHSDGGRGSTASCRWSPVEGVAEPALGRCRRGGGAARHAGSGAIADAVPTWMLVTQRPRRRPPRSRPISMREAAVRRAPRWRPEPLPVRLHGRRPVRTTSDAEAAAEDGARTIARAAVLPHLLRPRRSPSRARG